MAKRLIHDEEITNRVAGRVMTCDPLLSLHWTEVIGIVEWCARNCSEVDSVPVVRCSDCTHRIGGTSENIELRCGLKKAGMEMGLPFIMPSYYCSHGERKTGENNNRP